MELSRFLASSLPQPTNGSPGMQLVFDNARSHSQPKPTITSQANRRTSSTRKINRWDGSLTKRELTVPSPFSPKRSTGSGTTMKNIETKSLLPLRRVNDDLYTQKPEDIIVLREVVVPTAIASNLPQQQRLDSGKCIDDMVWEERALSKESTRDHKDPPRMPIRNNADYYSEVDEQRAVICFA